MAITRLTSEEKKTEQSPEYIQSGRTTRSGASANSPDSSASSAGSPQSIYPNLSNSGLLDDSVNESASPSRSPPRTDNQNTHKNNPESLESLSHFSWKWLLAVGSILIFVLAIFMKSEVPEDRRDCPNFINLTDQFPSQDKRLFKYLKLGVEGVFNNDPTKPTIFCMISNDPKSIRNIMKEVIENTQFCFRSSGLINLSAQELSDKRYIKDNSLIVSEYRELLESSGIMLVNDFNKVDFQVVPAFHSICDVENPLVKKSIIFLTMHIPELPSNVANPTQYLHDYLRQLWEDKIKSNILEPLITRVTDQVLVLNPEL